MWPTFQRRDLCVVSVKPCRPCVNKLQTPESWVIVIWKKHFLLHMSKSNYGLKETWLKNCFLYFPCRLNSQKKNNIQNTPT